MRASFGVVRVLVAGTDRQECHDAQDDQGDPGASERVAIGTPMATTVGRGHAASDRRHPGGGGGRRRSGPGCRAAGAQAVGDPEVARRTRRAGQGRAEMTGALGWTAADHPTPATQARGEIAVTTHTRPPRGALGARRNEARPSGTAVRASPKLWMRSASRCFQRTKTSVCSAAAPARIASEARTARSPARERLIESSTRPCECPWPCAWECAMRVRGRTRAGARAQAPPRGGVAGLRAPRMCSRSSRNG